MTQGGKVTPLLQCHLHPHRAVIRRPRHAADLVIDAGLPAAFLQAGSEQDVVDAQAAPGLALEAAAAVVEPVEAVGHSGILDTEAVMQPPVPQGREPLTLFGQKAGLAGAQPAPGVLLADADIRIDRRDVEVPGRASGRAGSQCSAR